MAFGHENIFPSHLAFFLCCSPLTSTNVLLDEFSRPSRRVSSKISVSVYVTELILINCCDKVNFLERDDENITEKFGACE
jgi:hypothetical protein